MSKNSSIIRGASLNDVPELLPLLDQLGYPCDQNTLKTRIESFLKTPGYGVLVCDLKGEIIGLVAWSKSNLFVSDKIRFHIEALVVSEKHRGKGVGRELMTFVEKVAQENGPAIVDLTSGLRRARDGTHEFYKRLGYQNEGLLAKLYLRKEI